MFILFKFIIAIGAFKLRYSYSAPILGGVRGTMISIDDVDCKIEINKKKNKTRETTLTCKTKSKIIFKLNVETYLDKLFKIFGFSSEIQTNNKYFNSKVYIASDSLNFAELVKSDNHFQNIVLKLFSLGCITMYCDRNTFSARFKGDRGEQNEVQQDFINLFRIIENLQIKFDESKQDHFEKKVIFAETIIWSFFCFSVLSFFESKKGVDKYYEIFDLVLGGLVMGLSIFVILLLAIKILFKKSSRGHPIIIESAFLLFISLPIMGISLLYDSNIYLDSSAPIVIKSKVLDKTIDHRAPRYGFGYYKYYIEIEEQIDQELPRKISVSKDLYDSLNNNQYVEVKIGNGFFGYRWIKDVSVVY